MTARTMRTVTLYGGPNDGEVWQTDTPMIEFVDRDSRPPRPLLVHRYLRWTPTEYRYIGGYWA